MNANVGGPFIGTRFPWCRLARALSLALNPSNASFSTDVGVVGEGAPTAETGTGIPVLGVLICLNPVGPFPTRTSCPVGTETTLGEQPRPEIDYNVSMPALPPLVHLHPG